MSWRDVGHPALDPSTRRSRPRRICDRVSGPAAGAGKNSVSMQVYDFASTVT